MSLYSRKDQEREAWVLFANATFAGLHSRAKDEVGGDTVSDYRLAELSREAAKAADTMLEEWRKRFGTDRE